MRERKEKLVIQDPKVLRDLEVLRVSVDLLEIGVQTVLPENLVSKGLRVKTVTLVCLVMVEAPVPREFLEIRDQRANLAR